MTDRATGRINAYGDLFIHFPHAGRHVSALKNAIPRPQLSYSRETQTWTIAASHARAGLRILRAYFPDAQVTGMPREKRDTAPLQKARIDARRAFAECTMPVLQRDKRRCQYCGDPAAHVDQWREGEPNMDSLVACCLVCRTIGKDHYTTTIEAKAAWIATQRVERMTREVRDETPARTHPGRWRNHYGQFANARARARHD